MIYCSNCIAVDNKTQKRSNDCNRSSESEKLDIISKVRRTSERMNCMKVPRKNNELSQK